MKLSHHLVVAGLSAVKTAGVTIAILLFPSGWALADIYQWEYIDPLQPDLGRQASSTLAPDGAGLMPGPGFYAYQRDLTMAYLSGYDFTRGSFARAQLSTADFANSTLAGALFSRADLTNAYLTNANLSDAEFFTGSLTGADFTGATITGVDFGRMTDYGLTASQIYATASYQTGDLRHIDFTGNDLSGWDFSYQDLSSSRLNYADVSNAIFNGATINGLAMWFATDYGFEASQLYSTASYQQGDLSGMWVTGDFTGWVFAGKSLEQARFTALSFSSSAGSILRNADFSRANLQNASLSWTTLDGADFTDAVIAGAIFSGTYGFTASQLYSTASYRQGDLSGIDLSTSIGTARGDLDLTGWNFAGKNLTNASFDYSTLEDTDFTDSNLTAVEFAASTITNARFTNAIIRDADFGSTTGNGFTAEQLYSSASYQESDLRGVRLDRNDLTGWNLAGQDLTGSSFSRSTLLQTDFTGALISGADFSVVTRYGFEASQLYSTASYQQGNLMGINLGANELTAWDFGGQNLTGATFRDTDPYGGGVLTDTDFRNADLLFVDFTYARLNNVNFTGANLSHVTFPQPASSFLEINLSNADSRGAVRLDASLLDTSTTWNLIHPDGHVEGLRIAAGEVMRLWDYNEEPLPILVEEELRIDSEGLLRVVIEDKEWGSTLTFDSAVPVTLAGTLELLLDDETNATSLVGTTFQLFDWSGVSPAGQFEEVAFQPGTVWDTTELYTSGHVTLVEAVPEPATIGLLVILISLSLLLIDSKHRHTLLN